MGEMVLLSETLEQSGGYLSNRERGRRYNGEQLREVTDLVYNGIYKERRLRPHEREFLIREALTTSDFPYLFGDVLQRQVLASYKAVDPVWKAFVRMSTVPRIYPQVGGYRFAINGGDQYLAEVSEKGEYLASERSELRDSVYVKKYGRQFDISWESMINDDLGALKDTPQRFARAAVRTEHRLVTTAYANDLGTHAAGNIYDVTTANQINAANVGLTIQNLENACEAMMIFLDGNGEPIMNRPKYLVVPPALEYTARQILTSTNKMWLSTADDESASTPWPTTNVISQVGLVLIVDPYLAVINAGSYPNSWYLFADPADIAAIETDYLVGHESPEICMKASDKVSIGGGTISAMSGDFATDNVFYRVRDVFGANKLVTTGGWRATYMGYAA